MATLTPDQTRLLATLGPHTRGHAVQLLSKVPGLRISSARRSPERNRQVGGSPTSFHLRGRAVDLVGTADQIERATLLARNLRLGPRCTGPEEIIIESDHLHVAW